MKSIELIKVTPIKQTVNTTVKVPGSKSYGIRVLLISALCDEKFKVNNLPDSDDVKAMQGCINALETKRIDIEAKESGLTARLFTALASISRGTQIIKGSPGLHKRPIKDLVDTLRKLGAKIEYMEKEGFFPIKIISSELTGNRASLSGNISSQFLSALFLISPKLKNGLDLEIKGKQISKPYIDMTIDIMAHFGVKIENDNYRKYVIKPQEYKAKDYTVESDYSAASYFYGINYLTGSQIEVENLNPDSKQGDKKFIDLIKTSHELPREINAEDFPDQAMTLAVLAAFAPQTTVIKGIGSLRIKETERIRALENELAKMGIKTNSTNDSLTVYGGQPRSSIIDTYSDHRIAMSFAVAATKIGQNIMKPSVVDKTFPGFWEELSKITKLERNEKSFSNILLTGMRGSGKTTTGKLLAKKLGKQFIDMDSYLEEKHGRKVRNIVLEDGWDYFRDLESSACKDLSTKTDCVISSGGGVVLRNSNMDHFRPNTLIVLLKAKPNVLSRRIKHDKNRPGLSTQPTLIGELGEVWEKRKDKYYRSADFIIDTYGIYPKQIVNAIMEKLDK